jgi:hypothetical protein
VAVLSGFLLPMYTDEVGWRLQERAGLDGVDKLFSLLCGPTSLAVPPIWMMPARYYSAFWNVQFASPFYTRVSGILYALVWGALLARLIFRIVPDRERRRMIMVVGFALITLGVMPWLLTWSRPEQPILLSVTAALVVACGGWDRARATRTWRSWLLIAGVLAMAAIGYSYHLKAVFLFPVFLACVITSSRGRANWASRAVGGLVLAVLTAQGARYWIDRLQCAVDQKFLQSQNLGSKLLAARSPGDVASVFVDMLTNLNPLPYIARTVPRPNPLSAWLPEDQIGMAPALIWWGIATFAWCLGFAFAGKAVWVQAKAIRRDEIDPRMIAALALMISVLGWAATQPMKNDYESILIVPLLLLAIACGLSCLAAPADMFDKLRAVTRVAPWLGIVSMVLVVVVFAPSLSAGIGQQGYLSQQPSSVSTYGYELTRLRLLKLARSCGIDPVNSQNLVLDDVTYYPFIQSKTPDHAMGRFGPGQASDLTIDYLRGRNSSGYIASCSLLPRPLQGMAKRDGDFCCLAATWNAAPTPPVK